MQLLDRIHINRRFLGHAAFVVFLAAIVLLNLASSRLFLRADLTEERIHSLSPISRDTVRDLREPLVVRGFFSKDLPAPYNGVEERLRDLLQEFERENPANFDYSIYSIGTIEDMSAERRTEYEELAYEYRVFPVQIQVVERDEAKVKNVYMGVSFAHGDSRRSIQALTTTERMEYRVTQAIKTLTARASKLSALNENIYTMLFLSSSVVPAAEHLAELPAVLQEHVDTLNARSKDRLKFSRLDPDTQPEATEWVEAYSVPVLRVGSSADRAYATVVVTLSDAAYSYDLFRLGAYGYEVVDTDAVLDFVENAVDSLIGIHDEVGYLVDYDTPPYRGYDESRAASVVEANLGTFYEVLSSVYSIRPVFLQDESIPEDLETLIVVSPRERLSERALFEIDQFLMKGKSIMFFLDTHTIYMPMVGGSLSVGQPPGYEVRETGLLPLLEHYGVTLRRTYALDEQCFVQKRRDADGRVVELELFFAPEIREQNVNRGLDFLRDVAGMVMLNISPIELNLEGQDGVTGNVLFTTSENGWELTGDFNFNSPMYAAPPPPEDREQLPLACLVEGRFRSYFADKQVPERGAAEADGTPGDSAAAQEPLTVDEAALTESSGGKIFVLGTSAVLGNGLMDADGMDPNSLFFLNTLDYMNGNGAVAELRAKGKRLRRLDEEAAELRFLAKIFNIAGLPVIVMLAGGVVWLASAARRRRIRRSFAADGGW